MRSYYAYQNQISGYQDVENTIKTTEKIAASSIHLLKQRTTNLAMYITHLRFMLTRLLLFSTKHNHPFLKPKKGDRKALVIFTADKGLVGGLWHRVVNLALRKINSYQSVLIIGKKGKKYLDEENIVYNKVFSQTTDIPEESQARSITQQLFRQMKDGKFLGVDILYPKFINLSEHQPTIVSFIPFPTAQLANKEQVQKEINKDLGLPIFEPSTDKIFEFLIEKLVEVFFYQIMVESKLSELSARTISMEHAATKAAKTLQKLTISYRKERRHLTTQRQLASFTVHKNI